MEGVVFRWALLLLCALFVLLLVEVSVAVHTWMALRRELRAGRELEILAHQETQLRLAQEARERKEFERERTRLAADHEMLMRAVFERVDRGGS